MYIFLYRSYISLVNILIFVIIYLKIKHDTCTMYDILFFKCFFFFQQLLFTEIKKITFYY